MADSSGPVIPSRARGFLTLPQLGCLLGILAAALLLRVAGIDWGLPPATPELRASSFRGSYAFDEEKLLRGLLRTDPSKLDFDPKLYDWGTLHLELVLLALEASQTAGVFDYPWRAAFRDMIPGDFEKVYVVSRSVSVLADLTVVLLVWLLGCRIASVAAGLWAATLVAVSPGHLLLASQVRVDVTATALVLLTMLTALWEPSKGRSCKWLLVGLAAGLAIAAKYSSAPIVAAIAGTAVYGHSHRWHAARWLLLGAVAGFLIGEPFVLQSPLLIARQLAGIAAATWRIPEELRVSPPLLLGQQLINLARFSLGIPAALLALWGGWRLTLLSSKVRRLFLAAVAGSLVSLVSLTWPLMRYHLPLAPFGALAAGVALAGLPSRWRWPLGTVAATTALAAALAQLHFMTSPHPANLVHQTILKAATPGDPVSRMMPELPPLDSTVYPEGPNPLTDNLSANPATWVVTSDLPLAPYPRENLRLLETGYERVAVFRGRRILTWSTLGETEAPHDWKYTHPTLTLYRRK